MIVKINDGRISILIGPDETRIEIDDREASIQFVTIKLTPKQLSMALSRQVYVPCDINVVGLDRIGKKMEHKKFEFKMPPSDYSTKKEIAKKEVLNVCPDGWEPDGYFGSQDSFFKKGEEREEWARTTIRRWI